MSDNTDPALIGLTSAELLGVPSSEMVHAIEQRYSRLREEAGSVVGALAAQSQEFKRAQGNHNMLFIRSLIARFPSSFMDLDASSRETILGVDAYHAANIKDIKTPLIFEQRDGEPGDVLENIAGARASVIWLEQSTDEYFSVDDSNDYGKSRLSAGKVRIPHVIIGHASAEDTERTELLLHPIVRPTACFTHNGKRKGSLLSTTVTVTHRNEIIRASMLNQQYVRLRAIQDSLFSDRIDPVRLQKMFDTESGKYTVSPDTVEVVRAAPASRLLPARMRTYPSGVDSLDSDFDLTILDNSAFRGLIEPAEFLRYNVMEDSLRTAAMLGKIQDYNRLKNELEEKSQIDPEVSIINRPS